MQTKIALPASLPKGFRSEYAQATLYWHISFTGYSKCEARNIVVKTERYAQFHNSVKIELQLRGKRKWHFQRQTSNPSVVILAGWGHPDLPPALDSGGRARHYSFDQGWSTEFDAFLKSHLKSSNATILLDLRNHDSEEQKFANASAPAPTFLSSENRSTATDDRRKIPPVSENMADFFEGSPTEVVLTRYERDPRARSKCIEHHGCICSVCRFDFQRVYGELGKGFIHVHHVVPLSSIGEQYRVNPLVDLRPVCPNCHAMLHQGRNVMTIEELKKLIEKAHLGGG